MNLTRDDIKRIAWTFIQAALAVVIVYATGWVQGGNVDFKALVVAVVAAGLSAVKNLFTSEGDTLK